MSFDLIFVLILFTLVALGVLSYGVRVILKGQVHFDRVNRQGGSALLGKQMMELAYWCFQPIASLLIFCRFTANAISWASFFFGIVAGVCLAFGHFGFGAGFAAISAVMDSLDGIVARRTGQASDSGEVLDAAVDRYAEFFFLGGLVVYYREIPAVLILTLMALLGSFMVSYSTAKAEALHVTPPKGSMRRPERAVYLILGAALSPLTIPWLDVHREFPVAIAHPMVVALGLVGVLANLSAVQRLRAVAKSVQSKQS